MTVVAQTSMWEDLASVDFRLAFPVIDGIRTRVLIAGEGPPLLLLHGTGGHLETYQKTVGPLAEHFRVIVPDMIGHGYTDRPDVSYTLDDYADHLFALLDHFGINAAHLSGESLGGCIAAWMALQQPARATSLVLNTGILERPDAAGLKQLGDLQERTRKLMQDLSTEAVRRRMEWLVLDPDVMTTEMVSIRQAIYALPGMVDDVQKILHAVIEMNRGPFHGVDYLDSGQLAQLKCPTLVLWSDHNPGKPYEVVAPAINSIPGVEVHIVESAAHWPQFEQPEVVNRHMIDFLRGVV